MHVQVWKPYKKEKGPDGRWHVVKEGGLPVTDPVGYSLLKSMPEGHPMPEALSEEWDKEEHSSGIRDCCNILSMTDEQKLM